MSLFGAMGLMGDFDDDMGFMGNQMNAMNMQMRSMNRLMSSLMPDPFNMMTPFDPGFQQNAMLEHHGHHGMPMAAPMGGLFGFPAMPNMNRLLSADIGSPNGASYCTSSVISMSSGPDGRPQIYQATSSTKTGPGGIRETRRTVQDSTKGIKKMAIGHHIGERAHIIEKEQDVNSGQLEERQEFINLEEEQAEDFDREFTSKARMGRRQIRPQQILAIESGDDDDAAHSRRRLQHQQQQQQRRHLPALPAPPTQQAHSSTRMPSSSPRAGSPVMSAGPKAHCQNDSRLLGERYRGNHLSGATPRRPLRAPTSTPAHNVSVHRSSAATSVHPHPYNAAAARRNHRSKHSKLHQQHEQQRPIVELVDDDDDDDDDVQGATAIVDSSHTVAAMKSHQGNHTTTK